MSEDYGTKLPLEAGIIKNLSHAEELRKTGPQEKDVGGSAFFK